MQLLVSQDLPTQTISTPRHETIRSNVILELIHTEKDFVNIMTDVADGYMAECKRRPDMFTQEQINNIFSNLEELLAFQKIFLSDLEKSIDWEAPHTSCVGEVFLNNVSIFNLIMFSKLYLIFRFAEIWFSIVLGILQHTSYCNYNIASCFNIATSCTFHGGMSTVKRTASFTTRRSLISTCSENLQISFAIS